MAQRRAHVERPADLTFEQHIVTAQMDLGSFASRLQLLQMTVAQFVLLVAFVTDGLRVRNPFGNGRRNGGD